MAIVAILVPSFVLAQSSAEEGLQTRYFALNGKIHGKVVVRISRPDWSRKEILDNYEKIEPTILFIGQLLLANGFVIEKNVEGKPIPSPLCVFHITVEETYFQNCPWMPAPRNHPLIPQLPNPHIKRITT